MVHPVPNHRSEHRPISGAGREERPVLYLNAPGGQHPNRPVLDAGGRQDGGGDHRQRRPRQPGKRQADQFQPGRHPHLFLCQAGRPLVSENRQPSVHRPRLRQLRRVYGGQRRENQGAHRRQQRLPHQWHPDRQHGAERRLVVLGAYGLRHRGQRGGRLQAECAGRRVCAVQPAHQEPGKQSGLHQLQRQSGGQNQLGAGIRLCHRAQRRSQADTRPGRGHPAGG